MEIAQQVMALVTKLDSLRSIPRIDVMARVSSHELFSELTRTAWHTDANTHISKCNSIFFDLYILICVC